MLAAAESQLAILLVEDDSTDAHVVTRALSKNNSGEFAVTRVSLVNEAIQALDESSYDAILLDLHLPDSDGLATIASIHRKALETPIVVLTGHEDQSLQIRAIREGAQDYLVKDQINDQILKRVLHYSIERKRAEAQVRDSENRLRIGNRVLQVFLTSSDKAMYADVLEIILDVFKSEVGVFGRIQNHNRTFLRSVVTRDGQSFKTSELAPDLSDGGSSELVNRVLRERKAIFDNEIRSSAGVTAHLQRMMCAPVEFCDEVLGTILISSPAIRYREKDCALLENIAQMIAPVLGARLQRDRKEEQHKRAEEALLAATERAEVTLHCIGDGVIRTDADGFVEYMNRVAQDLTGWTADDAKGRSISEVLNVINEDSLEPISDPIAYCLQENRVISTGDHTVLINKSGAEYAIRESAAPIHNSNGKLLGVVLAFSDISEARRMSREMSHQATHDALTGLTNRRAFEGRLQQILETAETSNSHHALCYLDLDQFKLINDTCGHSAGDELLRQLSAWLQTSVRKRDTLARLGGDEFAIILEHCELQQAELLAHVLRKAVEDFRFSWYGKTFSIGVSIGLVPINAHSESTQAVLSAADAACYTAKEQGRNRIHVSDVHDRDLNRRHGEMQWVMRIRAALEKDQFRLCYQTITPVVNVDAGGEHYEVLLRMLDDDGTLISPGVFLPAAERYGLSSQIDRWVCNHVLDWLSLATEHLDQLKLCAINLSGQSLADQQFLDFLLEKLESTAVPAHKICFEITETSAIANLTQGIRFMKTLKKLGCQFALDDFGSGLSSFGYLKTLPVDILKIDGVFVKGIVDDPIDFAMVKSISEIGKLMGKQIVAEYVENEAILQKLQTLELDFVQGYSTGRPRLLETRFEAVA